MAWELWDMVCSLFGVHWVMPARVLDLLSCWQGSLGRHQNCFIWRAVPHCVMWCLWRERNARTFEGCERNIFDLKLLLLRTLFDWMLATGLFSFKIVFGILWSLYCSVIILSTSIKHTPSVLDASLWSIKFYYLLKKKKERDSHGCLSFPTILHPNMLLFFIYFLNIFLLFPYTY